MKILLCIFAMCIVLFQSIADDEITIGLDLSKELCEELERKISSEIADITVNVESVSDFNAKQNAVMNNTFEILEGGFKMFYEYKQKRAGANILLHTCFFNSYGQEVRVSGKIITRNPELSLDNFADVQTVYALSKFSSSGYYLQKRFLEEQGYSFPMPKFMTSAEKVIERLKADKKSIGFVGNFVEINDPSVHVIAETKRYPGGIVFVDTEAIPKELQMQLAQILRQFYIDKTLQPNGLDRLFIAPIVGDDYYLGKLSLFGIENTIKLLDHAAVKIGLGILIIAVIVSIVAGAFVLSMKKTLKRNQAKNFNSFLDQLSMKSDYYEIKGLLMSKEEGLKSGDFEKLNEMFVRLDELIKILVSQQELDYRKGIRTFVDVSEQLLSRMIVNINQAEIPMLEALGGKRIEIRSDFTAKTENYKAFCDNVDRNLNKLPEDALHKLGQVIYLPGKFTILSYFRNKTSHENKWQIDRESMLITVFAGISILKTVLSTDLFTDDQA